MTKRQEQLQRARATWVAKTTAAERSAYSRRWRDSNREKVNAGKRRRHKNLTQEQLDKKRSAQKRWRSANPDSIKIDSQRRKPSTKEQMRRRIARQVITMRNRRISDPLYRSLMNLRRRVRAAVKTARVSRSDRFNTLLGCSSIVLREWIQGQFSEGMSWENYGRWHIDHVRPCASFDLQNHDQQRLCFHYTNLQPLWATENLKKSSKF